MINALEVQKQEGEDLDKKLINIGGNMPNNKEIMEYWGIAI